jgi:hypothetical protein
MTLGKAVFRDSRRRRVLQEEARRAGECAPLPATEGSRYTDAANVENHPQITQYIPRKYRSYVLGLGLTAVGIGAIESLHLGSDELARAIQSGPIVAFDLAAGGGLAAWFAALMLTGLAVVAWMVYSLRRHRVDDYKGRYRLWLWIVGAALLASVDSVASLHQPWSRLWAGITGWPVVGGAIWWLVPVGVFVAWAAVRLAAETAECRGACTLVLVSVVAYAAALAASSGMLPARVAYLEVVILSSALLLGHAVMLAATTLYARYLVLDVQGLITRSAATLREGSPSALPAGGAPKATYGRVKTTEGTSPATLPLAPQRRGERDKLSRREAGAASARGPVDSWIDGSEPHDVTDDDNSPVSSKLSKADRKRLRKQHRQCA